MHKLILFFFYTDDCSPNADKMSWLGTLKYFKDKRGSRGNRKEPQATPLKEKKACHIGQWRLIYGKHPIKRSDFTLPVLYHG